MMYSGNQCCGSTANYAVSAARSPSGNVRGPWVKLERGGDAPHTILVSSARVTAPGHNAVIRDDAGVEWMLYHANDGPQCNAPYCPRVLFLDRIYYNQSSLSGRDDWPWTAGPSRSPQVAPTIIDRSLV